MNFNKHFEIKEGMHAFLGASKSYWLSKDTDQLLDLYSKQYVQMIGTSIHDIARKHIKYFSKITKASKKEIYLSLLADYRIPAYAVDRAIDFDSVFENLMTYVNDAVGYRMVPEQILKYSDNCFGTADSISDMDSILKNKFLRIHDLKTGITKAHIEQLEIYAALFCLEYNMKPGELDMELCIYQNNEILHLEPTAEDIAPIMDKIVTADKLISKIKEES